MMEALAIGLAVYGAAVTVAAIWLLTDNLALKKVYADWERVHESACALAKKAYEIIEANAGLIAAFDHDGDGVPGGSKPRGNG